MTMSEKVTHRLKCWPPYFEAIASGKKNFEVRRDDRGYQRGDVLILEEYDPKGSVIESCKFTGREERRTITWVLTGGQFGVEPGYVVLALGGRP